MNRFHALRRLRFEGFILLALLAYLSWTRWFLPSRERACQALAQEARMHREIRELEERLRILTQKCDALHAEDRETTEQAVREQLGWGRPGEVLVARPQE